MNNSIHYEGFISSVASRTYAFSVVEKSGLSRQFTVLIPSESFRISLLKYQDGPLISFERLQHEIDGETQEALAEGILNVSGQDIAEYMEKYYPKKVYRKWTRPKATSAKTEALAPVAGESDHGE
jgi:hypothetical protein